MAVSKPQPESQPDNSQVAEFDGIVIHKDPLTLSDGTTEVECPDAEIDVTLGQRVTLTDDGPVLADDPVESTSTPATDDRIPYRERGDGQPVTAWRFAPEGKRKPR